MNEVHQNFRLNKPIGIMSTRGLESFLKDVDKRLVEKRFKKASFLKGKVCDNDLRLYSRDTFIIPSKIETFGDGHLKKLVEQSVNGVAIYMIVDPTQRITYTIRQKKQETSPSDMFVETLSLMNAAKRYGVDIHLIVPYMFGARQDDPKDRESHDARWMAKTLIRAGAESIITVDTHNPTFLKGVLGQHRHNNLYSAYPLIKGLIQSEQEQDPNFNLDEFLSKLEVVSPDAGAIKRNDYFSKRLTTSPICNRSMDKVRDHETVIDGRNVLVEHSYYGGPVKPYVLLADDIIGSGGTLISAARLMKQNGAERVYFVATHPLFLKGPGVIDEVNPEGKEPLITRIIGTNASYTPPDVLERPWFHQADISSFLSVLIDEHHTYGSVSRFLDDTKKINEFLDTVRKNQ